MDIIREKMGKIWLLFLSLPMKKEKEGLPEYQPGREAQVEGKEKIKGILRLSQGSPAHLVLQYKDIQAEVIGDMVNPARKQPLSEETVLEKMKKTGNTPFIFEELRIEMDENVFLTVGALNHLRRMGLECLQEEILKKYRRDSDNPREISKKCPENPSVVVTKKDIAELRILVETTEQFQVALEQPEVARIYLESAISSRETFPGQFQAQVREAHEAGKKCYLALPYIFRRKTALWFCRNWKEIEQAEADGYLVRNYEEIQFLKEMGINPGIVQGDYNLYGYSNEAVKALEELSVFHVTFPVELNFKELKEIDCRQGEMLLYGYQPLMISSQCLSKNTSDCDHKKDILYLKDRYDKQFPVKKQCEDCYNIIYNISPISLLHHMGKIRDLCPEGIRLSFTKESRKETEHVFACYRQALSADADSREKYLLDYTNGHFTRGVE